MLNCLSWFCRGSDGPEKLLSLAERREEDTNIAENYVRGLQRDGRLLLRLAARRPERPLGIPASVTSNDGHTVSVAAYGILTMPPTDIAASPEQLAILAACVDDLSRRLAPASAASIRLSGAYLRIPLEDGEPFPADVVSRAERLRCSMNRMLGVAIFVTILAVLLLAHVDTGQRIARQLQETRTQRDALNLELSRLPAEAWRVGEFRPGAHASNPVTWQVGNGAGINLNVVPYCEIGSIVEQQESTDPRMVRSPAGGAQGARAAALCTSLGETSLREELVFFRLAAWNCRTYRIYTLWGIRPWFSRWWYKRVLSHPLPPVGDDLMCGDLPPPPPGHNAEALGHWQRTEMRTAGAISILTGFVLPLLLACVGGCAYALRRLDQKLSQWALEFNDGSHSWLRVLLASMLGGLLGVIWTGDGQVELGGYTLSLAAAAFFVGYSLEVVFTTIEAMVEGVAGKLRAPSTNPVTASAVQMTVPVKPAPPAPAPAPPTPAPASPAPASPAPGNP